MAKSKSPNTKTSKGKGSKSKVTATAEAITIKLSPAQKKKARECIRRSGAVTYTIKEIKLDDMFGTATAEVITD